MRKENHGDLEEFLADNKASCLSERSAKFAVEDILLGLQDLMEVNLFHRDVKLKNFVVAGWEGWNDQHKVQYDSFGCIDVKLYLKLIDFDFVDFIDKKGAHRKIGAAF
mmetsp:Transcript_34729/g.75798  ORF Transcript_34729/g.75798 Transcript_34729/m.75798 type:complete len:108 (+) Transcript_34729:375-698(+)|eukprot:CAMPEP_0116898506 /NCGR_PEP_ID=MMETSP0467-20121206/7226_1 /TAXON_ID=283647 /ORGANISM="Mesodinium pulex, Strain SPMC105" /LENGTH=107 /DNA_ID=CAMNT_0004570697 /DNA_START=492 /DNA_END=815 /DNA_ORIENTATION=+